MARDRIQPRWPDRAVATLARRPGGRRIRTLRRLLALGLLVCAGAMAIAQQQAPGPGVPAVELARDLPAGSRLGSADLRAVRVSVVPDGALASTSIVTGRTLTGPARRGELLTDARLVPTSGPSPGPGRAAVPITLTDMAAAELLGPGMHIAVIAVDEDGQSRTITSDAVVLSVQPAGSAPKTGDSRLVVLAVASNQADALAAGALTGKITVRFA